MGRHYSINLTESWLTRWFMQSCHKHYTCTCAVKTWSRRCAHVSVSRLSGLRLHWPTWRALIRHFSAFTAWWAGGVCVGGVGGGGGGEKKRRSPRPTPQWSSRVRERAGRRGRGVGGGGGGGRTPWKRWPSRAAYWHRVTLADQFSIT